MEFRKQCAAALDAGTPASEVMAWLRARYTTARSLQVQTCLVRQLCKDTTHSNVLALRVTRDEVRAIKRDRAQTAIGKNRTMRRIDGGALLREAHARLRDEATPTLDLALALLLLTGRRTCEVLNGRSVLAHEGPYAVRFGGQAKQRRVSGEAYVIPTLVPAECVVEAMARLRVRQRHAQLSNRETSRRYQGSLSRRLVEVAPSVGCVHGLRGAYACLALRLFDWGDASPAFVTMTILGHRGLHESLVYTPFSLETADDPDLVPGRLGVVDGVLPS